MHIRLLVGLLLCGSFAFIQAQISVPTFGTRGTVSDDLVLDYMQLLRTEIGKQTALEVRPGELITPGIAASLEPRFIYTIADLDGARYAVSGELRRAQPGNTSAPYVLSIMIADAKDKRSSDLISEPLNPALLAENARTVASYINDFISPTAMLEPGNAGLLLSSQPAGADIYINGANTGQTPSTNVLMLKEGYYTIELRKSGYLPSSRRVELKNNLTEVVSVELTPAAGGSIQITTQPRAFISIDGQSVGTSPMTLQALPGTHTVRLERPGFENLILTIPVRDYRVSRIDRSLRPLHSTMLFWDAEDKLLFIDDELQIRSFSADLSLGFHTIRIREKGTERSFQVNLSAAGVYELDLLGETLIPLN